jgi:hypothetical protein
MNSPALGLRVAAVISGLVGVAHVFRLLLRIDIVIGGQSLPLWLSGVAVLGAGALGAWWWRLATQIRPISGSAVDHSVG